MMMRIKRRRIEVGFKRVEDRRALCSDIIRYTSSLLGT